MGVTGLKIIRAIIAGERSPEKLASFRDGRCKKSEEVIAKSLHGNYRDEHLFALQQSVELFDTYQVKIIECDLAVEKLLNQYSSDEQDPSATIGNKKKRRKNELHFNAENHLKQMTGVDLTQIDGLSTHSVLRIISEIGVDMSKWLTAKHFGSWLGLSPGTKISGGKKLGSRTKPSANRAATMLRIAASTLHRSNSALGAFLRRLKSKVGAPKAITATAYKIARLIYSMMKHGQDYVDAGQDYYDQQYKERIVRNMQKRAHMLGFELTPIQTLTLEVP